MNIEKQDLTGSSIDLYSVNYDHPGLQMLCGNQEQVLYHENSIMRIWYNNVKESYPMHWHTALEILMPVTNYYDVDYEKETMRLQPEEILIIPPGIMHGTRVPDTGVRYVFIFDISLMIKLTGFARIQHIFSSPIRINTKTYPNCYDDIKEIIIKIRDEYFTQAVFYEMTIYSLLLQLFTKLGYNHINAEHLFTNTKPHMQRKYIQKFNSLLDYIDKHYMEYLSLDDAATSMGFSKFHFSRLFHQYTSFTFCDYINFRRIKAAEELLCYPELSITEVAMQSGFPSISTFNRLFKQNKGCSPSDFRLKNDPMSKN